ncbi:hypothetical protein WUBG_05032 [Wuchereria bancrofti]|uniref:Uncharacterized protein n=1 Tax=Wuchereria bancrofti TaxID=6293 RepID=J9F3N3_WUCBA|nr:hypothetical protein WUBG_05032 [Wuchereria bancrofti]
MAYVVFQDVGKAELFVAKNDGTSVMGQAIKCIIDPYAKEISRLYEERAVETAPIPRYLSRLDHNRLTEFRRVSCTSISECKRKNSKILISPSPSTSAQQSSDFKASELSSKKQPVESEAASHRQVDQQSVEAALTKIAHIGNVVPSNERPTVPPIAGYFASSTTSPSVTTSCPLLKTTHQTFCSHHFISHQQSQTPFTYHSIPVNPISPLPSFPSVSPSANVFSSLPPIAGRMPFPVWSNLPSSPLRTSDNTWPRAKTVVSAPAQPQVLSMRSPAPTALNFVPTTYQAVPGTSCEEVAPMDPAPSKESEERKKPETAVASVQRRKRSVPAGGKIKVRKRRFREAIPASSASGSTNSESDERSELSKESSQDSSSTVEKEHRHRKKGIVEERKYYKRKGAGGTSDYYKEIVIRRNDNTRKCSHEPRSNSPELVEEVESYQRIRKYKKQHQEITDRDEHFVEPDVDLPDLESVSSDSVVTEDQLSTQQQELKVQLGIAVSDKKTKSHRKALSMKHIRQQQSKYVGWRKKRIMKGRRRQRDHRSYRDRENSSFSGNEKGHRWSSSSSTTESETESDGANSFRNCRAGRRLSSLHSPKNLQVINLSDMVEAVTASSEESHSEEAGTSGLAHQSTSPHMKNSLIKKNESTQSLPILNFITLPEKLSGDCRLPCVMQSTPPAESSRPSFERRLENLFRSTSVHLPPSMIAETHEEERPNDAVFGMPFLTPNTVPNTVELKGMPMSETFLIEHSNANITVAKQPSDLNSA